MNETLKEPLRLMSRIMRLGSVLPLGLVVRTYGGSDKWLHGYTAPYQSHFKALRWHSNRVLEIGVGLHESRSVGGSLRIWRDYFPRSEIIGLDLFEKDVQLGRRVSFVQGDQSSAAALDKTLGPNGRAPNIVIDDGSHLKDHAMISFAHLFPLMPRGSVYAIEDLHTSYWPSFGGAVPAPEGSAVNFVKRLVDSVQGVDRIYQRKEGWATSGPPIEWPGIASVHVYPGLVIVRKE